MWKNKPQVIKHNRKDDFLMRWNSSCFLMYINLTEYLLPNMFKR